MVVSQTKVAAGKEIVPVTIVAECSRLAHQPINDVPVVNAVAPLTTQPGQALHQTLTIPELHVFSPQPHLYPLANKTAGHRIQIVLHPHRTTGSDTHTYVLA